MTRRLFLLNGIAILLVVLNHAVGWGFTAMFWWTDRFRDVSVPNFDAMSTPTYYILLIIKQLTPFCLPVFVVVSGYFLAFASRSGLSWKIVRARLKNILIPYLIWSVVVMALDAFFGDRFSVSQIVIKLLTGSASPIYYYVPLICQLFVLSPFLIPLLRSAHWKKVLAAAGLLQFLTMIKNYLCIFGILSINIDWFFGNLVFYFVLGIALNFHLEEIKAWIHRRRRLWPAALVVFAVLAVIETEVYSRNGLADWRGGVGTLAALLYILSFLMVFIEFDHIEFRYAALLGKIGQKAYGIYLLHPIVLLLTAKVIYHVLPMVLGWQWLFQPLLFSIGIAAPLIAMKIVAQTPLRRGYHYLFG